MSDKANTLSEQIVKYIQEIAKSEVFEPRLSLKRKAKHDEWRESWLKFIENTSDEQRSLKTVRYIQDTVQKRFGAINVLKEKPIANVIDPNATSHAFDLFVPSERTAIEICLSAIKNEFEKDILKAMLDGDTATLYIITRDYVTGRNETVYGVSSLRAPGPKHFIDLAKIYKLRIYPIPLCPIDE